MTRRKRPLRSSAALAALPALAWGCTREVPKPAAINDSRPGVAPTLVNPSASADAVASDAEAGKDAADVASPSGAWATDASDDPETLHRGTKDELLPLFTIVAKTDRERTQAESFLSYSVGPTVSKINQGNKAIAHHAISKRACLMGLQGVTLQTDAQRARCGAENMVPIWKGGDPSAAKVCIDQFEFPNQVCELPMVWAAPTQAERVCEIAGKRLCTQDEWTLACRGDPEGKQNRVYAYGDALDLTICNTSKPHPFLPDGRNWICYVRDAETAWRTCETDTEPSGAFPQCRSRFGVFDQHGNVAEIMTRDTFTQLKGSAFFYIDVARKHNDSQPKDALRETYPDNCSYDPRWHVEPMDAALHVNYHLGFRCCKSIPPPPPPDAAP